VILSIGMMPTLPSVSGDDVIEEEANRMLWRLLRGGKIRPLGSTATEFHQVDKNIDCPVCGSGKLLDEYQAKREHAFCLCCTRATKHFQACIDKTLRTMEQKKKFARMVRHAELVRRARQQKIKTGKGRPNAESKQMIDSLKTLGMLDYLTSNVTN
jgi:hypothetical protein